MMTMKWGSDDSEQLEFLVQYEARGKKWHNENEDDYQR